MGIGLRTILGFVASTLLTAVFVPLLLPILHRLKAGQTIREEGPEAHQIKNGTPTMGGVAFIFAVVIAALVFGKVNAPLLMMIAGMLMFGLVGFIDDYIKVVKKRNLGLKAWQKIVLQFVFATVLAVYAYKLNGGNVFIPFAVARVNFGIVYIPFAIFVCLAMSNAVNLTDGLDGLASGVTAIVAAVFTVVGSLAANDEISVFSAVVMGACVGFYYWNHHPAKLFMGDTGSMALGGALAALAMIGGFEFLLPIAGGIYVAEAMSVIIQVFVFKTQNGRRFFRMAPLHHHYELGGMSEVQVVKKFMITTIILGVITIISLLI